MQRENQTQRLTFSASMTALGVILLLLGSMLPGMRVACAAVAGVAASLVVIRCGLLYALLSVVATAVLSFLLVPAKELALLEGEVTGIGALMKFLRKKTLCCVCVSLTFLLPSCLGKCPFGGDRSQAVGERG